MSLSNFKLKQVTTTESQSFKRFAEGISTAIETFAIPFTGSKHTFEQLSAQIKFKQWKRLNDGDNVVAVSTDDEYNLSIIDACALELAVSLAVISKTGDVKAELIQPNDVINSAQYSEARSALLRLASQVMNAHDQGSALLKAVTEFGRSYELFIDIAADPLDSLPRFIKSGYSHCAVDKRNDQGLWTLVTKWTASLIDITVFHTLVSGLPCGREFSVKHIKAHISDKSLDDAAFANSSIVYGANPNLQRGLGAASTIFKLAGQEIADATSGLKLPIPTGGIVYHHAGTRRIVHAIGMQIQSTRTSSKRAQVQAGAVAYAMMIKLFQLGNCDELPMLLVTPVGSGIYGLNKSVCMTAMARALQYVVPNTGIPTISMYTGVDIKSQHHPYAYIRRFLRERFLEGGIDEAEVQSEMSRLTWAEEVDMQQASMGEEHPQPLKILRRETELPKTKRVVTPPVTLVRGARTPHPQQRQRHQVTRDSWSSRNQSKGKRTGIFAYEVSVTREMRSDMNNCAFRLVPDTHIIDAGLKQVASYAKSSLAKIDRYKEILEDLKDLANRCGLDDFRVYGSWQTQFFTDDSDIDIGLAGMSTNEAFKKALLSHDEIDSFVQVGTAPCTYRLILNAFRIDITDNVMSCTTVLLYNRLTEICAATKHLGEFVNAIHHMSNANGINDTITRGLTSCALRALVIGLMLHEFPSQIATMSLGQMLEGFMTKVDILTKVTGVDLFSPDPPLRFGEGTMITIALNDAGATTMPSPRSAFVSTWAGIAKRFPTLKYDLTNKGRGNRLQTVQFWSTMGAIFHYDQSNLQHAMISNLVATGRCAPWYSCGTVKGHGIMTPSSLITHHQERVLANVAKHDLGEEWLATRETRDGTSLKLSRNARARVNHFRAYPVEPTVQRKVTSLVPLFIELSDWRMMLTPNKPIKMAPFYSPEFLNEPIPVWEHEGEGIGGIIWVVHDVIDIRGLMSIHPKGIERVLAIGPEIEGDMANVWKMSFRLLDHARTVGVKTLLSPSHPVSVALPSPPASEVERQVSVQSIPEVPEESVIDQAAQAIEILSVEPKEANFPHEQQFAAVERVIPALPVTKPVHVEQMAESDPIDEFSNFVADLRAREVEDQVVHLTPEEVELEMPNDVIVTQQPQIIQTSVAPMITVPSAGRPSLGRSMRTAMIATVCAATTANHQPIFGLIPSQTVSDLSMIDIANNMSMVESFPDPISSLPLLVRSTSGLRVIPAVLYRYAPGDLIYIQKAFLTQATVRLLSALGIPQTHAPTDEGTVHHAATMWQSVMALYAELPLTAMIGY